MNKNTLKRRCLPALLAALMLVSCGETISDDTTAPENDSQQNMETELPEEETRLYPEIPAGTDYGGYTFRFVGYQGGYTQESDYVCEEGSAMVLSDAVYRRNLAVSELLNVQFTEQTAPAVHDIIKPSVVAGDDICDLAFLAGHEIATGIMDGAYAELTGNLTLSWDAPWYDKNCIDALTIQDMLFSVNCDITTQHYNETSVVFFNKDMITDHALQDPYALTTSGTWTVDKMEEYGRTAAQDLNGDGSMDGSDIYGIVGNTGMCYIFFIGEGGNYTRSAEEGLALVFGEENNINRMLDVLNRFPDYTFLHDDHHNNDITSGEMFKSAQALFYVYGLGSIHGMRETEVNFGILPVPKANEEQDRYYNNVNSWANAFMCLPRTNNNIERTSVITDVLAAESHYTLRLAYYDIAMKNKLVRDAVSAEMLDLIFENRAYEIAIQYRIGSLVDEFCGMFTYGGTDVVSKYESSKKAVNTALENFYDRFMEMTER